MISSVVARFTPTADVITTIDTIAARDGIDVGDLIDGRLLPITIEAGDHSFHLPKSVGIPQEEVHARILKKSIEWLAGEGH